MMSTRPRISWAASLIFITVLTAAQTATPPKTRAERKSAHSPAASARTPGVPRMPVDPQIAAALKDVSAARVRATIEKLVSFNSRNSLGSADASLQEKGQGVVAAREWIKSEFERYSADCGGCLEVKTDSFIQPPGERIPKPTEMTNVYAVLRGTDPDAAKRMVLVTGHYDTVVLTPLKPGEEPPVPEPGKPVPINPGSVDLVAQAPGANDDGSGTAVSLECARVLSKHKFPATIIFLTVPGEEQGLNGSLHFAHMAKQEGWNLLAALNNDIVGGNHTPGDSGRNPHRVRVFSEGVPLAADMMEIRRIRRYGWENDSPSRQVARYIGDVGRTYLPSFRFMPEMIFRADRFGRGGDHTSFNREGFPAVRFTEDREDLHHQHQYVRTENGIEYGDLPKFVDFDYTANVARVNAATLAALASAPPAPTNVKIDMRAPGNTTTLTWDANPAGNLTFEVLWRSTTAPDWEHAKNVGNVSKVVMDDSKDNVMFAVRTVDKTGHRSLAVIPRPSGRERRVTYEDTGGAP